MQIIDHCLSSHLEVKQQEAEVIETYSCQSVLHKGREPLTVPLVAAQWSWKLALGKTTYRVNLQGITIARQVVLKGEEKKNIPDPVTHMFGHLQ